MPPVRIRDNMQLGPNEYRIKIRGNSVASGRTFPGKLLAMDSGVATGQVQGEPTKEPAFGLDAWWITPAQKARAEALNFTVVDPTSVLATHLTEVVRRHAHELLTREEVNNLVEGLKQKAPKLVEETIPTVIKTADLQKVLQNLLRERVSVRDTETIVETLAEWAPKTKDADILTEYVRNAVRRAICQQYTSPGDRARPRLACITLDPSFEDLIAGFIDRGPAGTTLSIPARIANEVASQILRSLEKLTASGHHPVVIASPQVRAAVRQIVEPHQPSIAVLGYNEIEPGVEVESLALVTRPPAREPAVAA
jgi:flagellar biosynthesis protein FlhA